MKRRREGGSDNGEICIVQVSPLLNQSFGQPVGANQDEIVDTAATILYYKMSVGDVRRDYNRTVLVSLVPAPGGNPAAFALGFLRGLEHVRAGRRRDKIYAFDAALVHQRMLEMALDPSETDSTSSSDDEPVRVAQPSSEDEPESIESESDADFLLSGESSEQDE